MRLRSESAKARYKPAQGNALSKGTTQDLALLRSHEANGQLKGVFHADHILSRPDGAESLLEPEPKALPWAGMAQTVGLPETGMSHVASLDEDTFHCIETSSLRSDGTATSEIVPLN